MNVTHKLRLTFAAAALVALALLSGGCAAEEEIQAAANREEASQLRPELQALVDAGVPGAVLFVEDPNADPIAIAAGVADVDSGRPVGTDDRFRIGSIAKPYVATVVMQLTEEGTLSLDDTVESWLPGLVPGGDEITVRDLLGHRSGLFEYEEDPRVLAPYLKGDFGYRWKPRELIRIATEHPPTATPGTRVVYSNTNYTVLGLIVQAATGDSLKAELERRIFGPLNLGATSFVENAEIEAPFARGYLNEGGKLLDVTAISPSHYWAAGNIVSNATDVGRFFEALLDGELLEEDSMETMRTYVEEKPDVDRGLGLARGETDCGSWEGHDGSVPGYDAVARHLDTGRQVVLLTNTVTMGDSIGSPAAQRAMEQLMDAAACR
jgi:D-alanyl-D-alanine carboxypeptidase